MGTSWAVPPSKATPSMVPTKSIMTRSSRTAGRATSGHSARWRRMRSSIFSTSSSVTVALGRLSVTPLRSATAISGNTSKLAEKRSASPPSAGSGRMSGLPAGRSWCSPRPSMNLPCSSSPTTSSRRRASCWRRTTDSGALPGRKPFTRAWRASWLRRVATCCSTSVAGRDNINRRFKAPVFSSRVVIADSEILVGWKGNGAKGETRTLTGCPAGT